MRSSSRTENRKASRRTKAVAGAFLAVLCVLFAPVQAGHELPYYPSFYPQEIRIETMRPEVAAALLQNHTLHAYIGEVARFGEHIPADVHAVTSLQSYLVVTFNRTSTILSTSTARCAAAQDIQAALAGQEGAYIFHPYPVTPYHGDYLHHFDRVEASKAQSLQRPRDSDTALSLRLRASGERAEHLLRSQWQVAVGEWDATVEEIALDDLLLSHTSRQNGWLGPPWLKEGWFHAYLLLADTVSDLSARQRIEAVYRRLVTGAYQDAEDHLNLERTLVARLHQGCDRVVVGYAVRHDYFNAEFSAGIENIAYDSLTGFHSPIFLRTVKLKDLPWNGWLRLGMGTEPAAAWNPIGGFTDSTGRLIWYAVGDLAMFPAPYSGSWTLNRIADTQATMRSQADFGQAQVTTQP